MNLKAIIATQNVYWIDGEGEPGELAVSLASQLLEDGAADVRLAMPGFAEITGPGPGLARRFDDANLFRQGLSVPFGNGAETVDVYRAIVPQPHHQRRLSCYLFRCPKIFDAPDPVTGRVIKDAPEKAIFFCRALLEFIRSDPRAEADVIHCNDWQTGLIPVYLRTLYQGDPRLGGVATVYTIHNASGGFEGSFPDAGRWLALAGLQKCDVFQLGETRSLEHHGRFSFTKGGIGFADLVNTVSRQHRAELLALGFAGSLDGVLRERGASFDSVPSGIDQRHWNPADDPFLKPAKFADPASKRSARHPLRCKLREWCPPDPDRPRPFHHLRDETVLFTAVTPINFQKVQILVRAIARISDDRRSQVAILGDASPGDDFGEGAAQEMARIANWPKVFFVRHQDNALAHQLYAASDIVLLPSVSDPSGLSALVAMRYGTIPLARKVGGLADRIIDENDPRHRDRANGFLFREPLQPGQMLDAAAAADALVATAQRAARLFREKQKRWTELVRNALDYDSSWAIPSVRYLHLYREATRRASLRERCD